MTWELSGGGTSLDQVANTPLDCVAQGCAPTWDDVRHFVVKGSSTPFRVTATTGEPWVRADGTGIDVRIESSSVRLSIKHVERDGTPSARPLRVKVVGKSIDFDSDGKIDLELVADDWHFSLPGSPGADTYDLRSAAPGAKTNFGEPLGVHVYAGAGNDVIYGSPYADSLSGGAGADRIYGGASRDGINGGAGRDFLYGQGGNDNIYGGSKLDGASAAVGDVIYGGPGYNGLYGSPGADRIYGGPNRDWIHGFEGNDLIYGGAGPDVLTGGKGRDRLYGGTGDDDLVDHEGIRNLAYGGPGKDYINFGTLDGPWKLSARTSIANCGPGTRDFTPERYPHRIACERVL